MWLAVLAVVARWIPETALGGTLPIWTRALAAEFLTNPVQPLEHDLLWAGAAAPIWRQQLVDDYGFAPAELPADGPALIGFFDGYAYLNASLLRVLAARTPMLASNHADTSYLGHHPDLPGHIPEPWHEASEATIAALNRWLRWVTVEQDQSGLDADRHASTLLRAQRPDLGALGDRELLHHTVSHLPLARSLFGHYLAQTLAASVGPGLVSAVCHEIGVPAISTPLIAGLGQIDSVGPAKALWTLSRVVRSSDSLSAAFDAGPVGLSTRLEAARSVGAAAFLAGLDVLGAEVGPMGPGEWELATPSWETEPDQMLAAIDWMRRCDDELDPSIGFARVEADRMTLVKEVGDIISDRDIAVTREQFGAAISATAIFIRGRERARTSLSRVVNEIRLAIDELGGRATSRQDIERPDDLLLLFADEFEAYALGRLTSIADRVAERRAILDEVRQHEPPFVIDDAKPAPVSPFSALFGEVLPMAEGEVLLAEPGSTGRARGRARVLSDIRAIDLFEPGDVVVTKATSAPWLPYIVGLAALVVDAGTMLSLPAVIGRELGLPVVVGALGALQRIPDGALVEVDGETGIVTLVER